MKIKFLTRKIMFVGAPWGPHPRGRSLAGPQQESFVSQIGKITGI